MIQPPGFGRPHPVPKGAFFRNRWVLESANAIKTTITNAA